VEHRYPRRLYVASVVLQDVVLAAAFALLLSTHPGSPFARVFAAAALVVLVWGGLTLHFPSRVVLDGAGISFHRYGRAHWFAWSDVQAVRVRRFLVRDRVLVRILPSPPWRGRYWILDGIERFEELVGKLESRRGRLLEVPSMGVKK
jgi:hypothetical protein